MKYKVTFRKRFNRQGEPADDPTALVSAPDGVIQDAAFVETIPPRSTHVTGDMEEDDSFLAFGSEAWVYDVADGRQQDFRDALVNSEVVLDFEEVPDESLTT